MRLQINAEKNIDRRRWIMLFGGVLMMIVLAWGATWSVIYNPMMEERGISSVSMDLLYSLSAVFSAIATLVGGRMTDKLGSTHVLFGCMLSFAAGQFICGITNGTLGFWIGNIIQVWPLATIMTAVGANTMKLFPDWKGLGQGVVGLGISIGGVFTAPLCQWCIDTVGLSNMFYLIGALFTIIGFVGLFLFPNCPAGYIPAGYDASEDEINEDVKKGGVMNPNFVQKDYKGMMKDKAFWILMAIPILGMTMYMLLGYQMARIAEELLHIEPMQAAFLVSVTSAVDFIVIVVCPISDRIGRLPMVFALFALGTVASVMFIFSPQFGVGYFVVCTIIYCSAFGAFGFIHGVMASDLWGSENYGFNGGITYLPVLASSVISPWFLHLCRNADGSTDFVGLFIIAAIMCAIGTILAFILWRMKRFDIEVFPPAIAKRYALLKKEENQDQE